MGTYVTLNDVDVLKVLELPDWMDDSHRALFWKVIGHSHSRHAYLVGSNLMELLKLGQQQADSSRTKALTEIVLEFFSFKMLGVGSGLPNCGAGVEEAGGIYRCQLWPEHEAGYHAGRSQREDAVHLWPV